MLAFVAVQGYTSRKREAFDLPGIGHEKGSPSAPVVIIEFADFSCTACARFARETLPNIQRDWIATGRARMRVLPFDALKSGRVAARAAECAGEQNRFWPMHDLLYARRDAWVGHLHQREIFESWASGLHMDMKRFRGCWNSSLGRRQLQQNNRLARSFGVPGTPAFSVNGRPVVGALPYGDFKAVLDAALSAK